MIEQVARSIHLTLGAGRRAVRRASSTSRDIGSFISIRGFFVSFLVLLAGWPRPSGRLLWLVRRLLRWWRGPDRRLAVADGRASSSTAGWPSCSPSSSLRRTPAETQSEFAVRASRFLTGQGTAREPSPTSPQQVVDAFYRVRFGHLELEPQDRSRSSSAELDCAARISLNTS